jgi:nucleoside-diphosphate-sugar epimerase
MPITLLTGASGFLGKEICRQLSFLDEQYLTLGRQKTNQVVCDLSFDFPIFNLKEIDCVIHAAGKAHSIPKTGAEKKIFFDINLTGTNNLLKAFESLDKFPKSFVFISTVAVYGRVEGTNICENMPLGASDPYGLSKIKAEQLVKNWCFENNVVCTILRLPLLVGKNPPGNLGSMLNAIRKGYYFNIDGGKAKKSMVLAEDVAKFIPKIKNIGGTYNLTDGIHPNFNDLSEIIAKSKVFNIPLNIAKLFGYLGDYLGAKSPINSLKILKMTSNLTFDDTKAREFGWVPQNVLEYLKHNDL